MTKRELKIGEVFQCGVVKLRVEEAEGMDCVNCFFWNMCVALGIENMNEVRNITGGCCILDRDDEENVVFVKVED